MSDEQRPGPQLELDRAIARYQRQGWTLIWRRDDPPRVRLSKQRLLYWASGQIVQPSATCTGTDCIDFTIDANGKAIWGDVPCESDDAGVALRELLLCGWQS